MNTTETYFPTCRLRPSDITWAQHVFVGVFFGRLRSCCRSAHPSSCTPAHLRAVATLSVRKWIFARHQIVRSALLFVSSYFALVKCFLTFQSVSNVGLLCEKVQTTALQLQQRVKTTLLYFFTSCLPLVYFAACVAQFLPTTSRSNRCVCVSKPSRMSFTKC